MVDRWQFLDASEEERALFPDLRHTLQQAGDRVALPNRHREVRRIDTASGSYYLKLFHRTQLKNRVRNAITAPRCRLDAEREWLVGRALRERGIETARPVALGVRGALSCYLCATIDGTSVRQLLEQGRWPPAQATAVARFCSSIAARGVVLTDLSAEHVFALDLEAPRFAVIDLHNGRLGARPRDREASRILRHFERSVRGLPVSHAAALRFATRLLRGMGLRATTRQLLSRQPPLRTHRRYDVPGKTEAYGARDPGRHARELACLRRVWPGRRGDLVLDVPCGAGRLADLLEHELGATRLGADRSRAMLDGAAGPRVQADAAELPFGDRALDGVVVFRFLHHLDRTAARAVLTEAARVADRYVVVSFFHPISVHGLRRRLTHAWSGTATTRHALGRRQLTRWLESSGFRPRAWTGERRYLRELWVAAFDRQA